MRAYSILTGLIVLTMASLPGDANARFWDVEDDHIYGKAIDFMLTERISTGFPDRSFRPELAVTRAEFTKFLVSSLFSPYVVDTCLESLPKRKIALDLVRFEDVDYDEWYGPYLCTAVLAEIVSGYPDGTFQPEEGVNFAEASKMLANAFGILSTERHQPGVHAAPWYRPYVEDMEAHMAIPPTIRGFEYPVTRGEMAEMIYRLSNVNTPQILHSSRTLTYSELSETVERLPYVNKEHRFALTYPATWLPPYFQTRGEQNDGPPIQRSDWRLYLGLDHDVCDGFGQCNGRSIYIDGYKTLDIERLMDDFYNNNKITVVEDQITDTSWSITYFEQSSLCTSKRVLVMGNDNTYRLTAHCAMGDELLNIQFGHLLKTFALIERRR
ncbi:MAG: S-layer homology domain-containing protein [bacterium]|nr:S-layer homology domain-containing protein [bacterium]